MSDEDADALIPVRMVNEVVYCPRLFWLEHVAGLFEENAHVVQGNATHRNVDKPGGAIEAPDAGDAPWHARSLWLTSDELGVSAKLDLVEEAADGTVFPVDTKKGRAPREGGLWPADEVQLVLQGLLLREHGFQCEKVAVYYAAERRRVTVALDEPRIARALAAVEEARMVQACPVPPAPLVDSPKCPGCSMNAVCQPDEVNAVLAGAPHDEHDPVRRVVPAQVDARPLYVVSPSARVGVSKESLSVVDERASPPTKISAGLAQVSHVSVFGTAAVSTPAIHACLQRGIPVSFHRSGGFFLGQTTAFSGHALHVRRAQFIAEGSPRAHAIARALISDKIANTRTLLRRNRGGDEDELELERIAHLAEKAEAAADAAALLAIEGDAAKRSWALFSKLLARDEPEFQMTGRTRRPPRDPSNAMLSFLYGVLTRDAAHAVLVAGLDPQIGVFHTAHHGRPSMALDLMEPFRSLIVESTVLGVVRRGEVTARGFVNAGFGVSMKHETKRALIVAYERRMSEVVTHPLFGYKVSYRQVLSIQARLLSRVLTGELAEMPRFRTR